MEAWTLHPNLGAQSRVAICLFGAWLHRNCPLRYSYALIQNSAKGGQEPSCFSSFGFVCCLFLHLSLSRLSPRYVYATQRKLWISRPADKAGTGGPARTQRHRTKREPGPRAPCPTAPGRSERRPLSLPKALGTSSFCSFSSLHSLPTSGFLFDYIFHSYCLEDEKVGTTRFIRCPGA
ncbi:hypothetical protein HJG60_011129 [Phyllostomus discolor]|uniref:Uncharacterized protein n=1 Tax=Phyllostomus discolor TaxID=89673 RepID=A0A834E1C8_9CHIR|nr:hypothetical protein HJG60_011129 [Phyllostomus discolor]